MLLLLAIALLSTLSNADGTYKWVKVGADIDGEAAYDQSGTSVSMSADGSIVAIGAANNKGNGYNAGHVRVYENQSDSWVQLGEDIEGDTNYAYASKVSMNAAGSILSVSARHGEDPGDYSGKLRVYKNQSGSWVQVGEDFNGEEYYDRVGQSSSFSDTGSILAIGANGKVGNGVRVYENQSDSWVQLGAVIDGEAALDRSGGSVSISSDGSRVAIGAIYNGENSGHVRVYEFQSENWVQLGADIDGEAANDYSGRSVLISADGSRVAIGAAYNDGNGWRSGHVRIYEFQAGSWVQLGADIDGEAALDNSGSSVSMSADGSVVAIGAQTNDGVNGEKSGHVRVFGFQSGNWVQLGADIDGEAEKDFSGASITLSADGFVIAIGAYANNGNGDDSGHVRVYKRELVAPTPSPTKSPTPSPSNLPTTSPTISPSISPTTSPTKSPSTSPTPSPTTSNPTTASPTTSEPTTGVPTTTAPTTTQSTETCTGCCAHIKSLPTSTTRIYRSCSGGFIPSEIEKLTALAYLNLSGQQLTGSIPDSISALTALWALDLGRNQLTGTIPDSIFALTALNLLSLGRNQLTGTIPDSISALTALTNLGLSSNQLTGTIPDSISALTALKYLYLKKNQLTGSIPDSISTLTALKQLYLANNDFCVSTNMKNFWEGRYNDASESNYGACTPSPTTTTQPTEGGCGIPLASNYDSAFSYPSETHSIGSCEFAETCADIASHRVVIDVRNGAIDDSLPCAHNVHSPLLLDRVMALVNTKDDPILVHCYSGESAYENYLLLDGWGFTDVRISGWNQIKELGCTCPADLDCKGTFSPCSADCELAVERVWTETQAKSGNGEDCPAAKDCQDGVGECLDCNDIKPPNWWKNPTCVLQDSSCKCGIRVKRDSIYCRKTCGLCGDREPATLHPTSSPTNVPTPACHDVKPPPWWKNPTCSLQLSSGKCQKRMEKNSKYCRKTCELCT